MRAHLQDTRVRLCIEEIPCEDTEKEIGVEMGKGRCFRAERDCRNIPENFWGEVRWVTGLLTCFSCSSHRYQTKDVLDKKDSTHPGIPLYFGCNCFNYCSSDPKPTTSEEY